jgi:hypothetical protein
MIRKRNDSVKPGMGVDGTEGENFTKRSTSPWNSNPRGNFASPKGRGVYQDASPGLTNKMPDDDYSEQGKYNLAGGARDILDAVEGQSSDSGNRAVRSGNKD